MSFPSLLLSLLSNSQVEQTCFAAVTILLSKVSHEPYGGASATGLTNLLYEVAMPQTLDPACDLSTPEVLVWSLPPAERNIHTISLSRKHALHDYKPCAKHRQQS